MNNEQRNALFGRTASYSDHKAGDAIQFRRGAEIRQGKVLHVRAPGPTHQGGPAHGMLYFVDTNEGIPVPVAPSQIIEGSFTAILASYGYADSAMDSRGEAEAVVWHFNHPIDEKLVIDTDEGRLRVLSARIEGTEEQGRVIGECEAVGSEEGH